MSMKWSGSGSGSGSDIVLLLLYHMTLLTVILGQIWRWW